MAAQAAFAALLGGIGAALASLATEYEVRPRSFFELRWLMGMGVAWAMAADAVRGSRVRRKSMSRTAHVGQVFVVVTGNTKGGTSRFCGADRASKKPEAKYCAADYEEGGGFHDHFSVKLRAQRCPCTMSTPLAMPTA